MLNKSFIYMTLILYITSLLSYYSQIKIVDLYGLDVKYHFDYYMSYLQIVITFVIFGLPNAITIMVSREKVVPKYIKTYSVVIAFISTSLLNLFFLDLNLFVQFFIFTYLFISLCNDLNSGIMNSIGMFEYVRVVQLFGSVILLLVVLLKPFDNFSDEEFALLFIIIPILPLFIVSNLGRKFRQKVNSYKFADIRIIFKYLNYIYFFSISSIIITKLPYINYSNFIDKASLAQYTLSVSLANFVVLPLNLLTLKILSSEDKFKVNIGVVNVVLMLIVGAGGFVLYEVSNNFQIIYDLTNISSSSLLSSTYILVAIIGISSINLSIALRKQENLKKFLAIDIVVIILVYIVTSNLFYQFLGISCYNYILALLMSIKLLLQVILLSRETHPSTIGAK